MRIRVFRVPSAEAGRHLDRLAARSRVLFDGEAAAVAGRALAEIRRGGDRALSRWRWKHDGVRGRLRGSAGRPRVSTEFRRAFELAVSRLTAFHSLQRNDGARLRIAGSLIEERVIPLDSVGVYVPGGEAPVRLDRADDDPSGADRRACRGSSPRPRRRPGTDPRSCGGRLPGWA